MDLLKQFRGRYPTARMTSELLVAQENQFVVRVTVEIPDGGTADGIAADAIIELAEDRARQRALGGLGLDPQQVDIEQPVPHLPTSTAPSKTVTPPVKLRGSVEKPNLAAASELTPQSHLPQQKPPASLAEKAMPTGAPQPVDVQSADISAAKGSQELSLPVSPKQSLEKLEEGDARSSTFLPEPEKLPSPINLSDIIAQTDVELRRLKWSVASGREYLEKTYNKRSRHDLTDEELLSFLLHLESLPTPQDTV